MSFNRGTGFGVGQHIGHPMLKRTADGAYVTYFWSSVPFRHNGVLISAIPAHIVTDGYTYTALTDAQLEAGYTPSSYAHNTAGR